jgi:hypothetical protein
MQHALHRPQTQKVAALAAALALAGAGGVAVIGIAQNDEPVNVSSPAVPVSDEPTGGSSPTPFGGPRPGVSEPTGGNTPQPVGGARP